MKNCVAGCKVYGNKNSGEIERYHHRDCPNYPESMSEVLDNYKEENKNLKTKGDL